MAVIASSSWSHSFLTAKNEYLYPDFLRVTGLPPLFSRSVVPALWSEVGLQARGRLARPPQGLQAFGPRRDDAGIVRLLPRHGVQVGEAIGQGASLAR